MKTVQLNPLKFPIYVIVKPAGASCNLSCSYCYYLEKTDIFSEISRKMSDSTLEKFTKQYIQAQPGQQALFTWHGGEPLLLGVDYFRRALAFQEKYKSNHHIDNVLQTNGTLLNDEWSRFFKDNNFLIGLSLDGPEHCHDHYRKNRAGQGSFAQTMKGLDLLLKHSVEFNILSVVNNYNVRYPLEVYHFFKSAGASYIQFTPVVERLDKATGLLKSSDQSDGTLAPWSVPAHAYGKFLCEIFDEWVSKDVGETFVTNFDATLACHVGAEPGVCTHAKTCGHASALDTNGDLYACDHYVFPEYKRGNISEKTITEMMLSEEQIKFGNDKRNNLPGTCLKCKYLPLCNGECPKNRILNIKGEKGALNYLCPGLKFYFNHTEPYMKFMANELVNERSPANIMQVFKK